MVFVWFSFLGSCVYLWVFRIFVCFVSTVAKWLERLIPEITCYVLSGTLNATHSLTPLTYLIPVLQS